MALIREKGWRSFTTREVLRAERSGLVTKADWKPALDALVEGELIRDIADPKRPKGGRPRTGSRSTQA